MNEIFLEKRASNAPPKKLVIARDRWLRAHANEEITGTLLNVSDHMCCLGFWCKQIARAEDTEIKEEGEPTDLAIAHENDWPVDDLAVKVPNDRFFGLRDLDSVEDYLIAVNDRTRPEFKEISDQEQEAIIGRAFQLAGTEVEFVDSAETS